MRIERWLSTLPLRWRALFGPGHLDRELDEELRHHLSFETERHIAGGATADTARRLAARSLGDITRTRERCHDARKTGAIEDFVHDLGYGTRSLRSTPVFTLISVLTLALGIGANTAIFSVVSGVLLVPLPFPGPDRLVATTGVYPKGAIVAMQEQLRFADAAAYSTGHEFTLTGRGEAVRVRGAYASATLLTVLGAQPALGRIFDAGEDQPGRDAVVILSHGTWEKRFGRDPGIIGRPLVVDGVGREVIGVMPPAFRFPDPDGELWVPLHNDAADTPRYWAGDFMPVVARLRDGASIEQARGELTIFQQRVRALFPWQMPADWNRDVSFVPLQQNLVAGSQPRLLLLLGAVVFVLLIACANVANLTIARVMTRSREMIIRSALGAGRWRMVRQLLTESLLLSALGGAAGLLLAVPGLSLIQATLPDTLPRLRAIEIDWRVLTYTAVIVVGTGAALGVVAAQYLSSAGIADALRAGGRGSGTRSVSRLRGLLIAGEIALASLLVVSAGLLIRSLAALSAIDPGFLSERVTTARIMPAGGPCREAAPCLNFYRQVLDDVTSSSGVTDAALVNTPPLAGRVHKRSVEIQGFVVPAGQTAPLFWLNAVTPHYFRVLGIPLLSGSGFRDTGWLEQPREVILTAATAERFWKGMNPVGRQLRFVGEREWRTVVGVAADVRAFDLKRSVPQWIAGTMYVPYSPHATLEDGRIPIEMTLAVKSWSSEWREAGRLRRAVAAIRSDVPVGDLRPLGAAVSDAIAAPASTAGFFAVFSTVALALGIIGIYGVLAHFVSHQTREIGIRMALGAPRGRILRLVIGEAAKYCAAGLAFGLGGAVLLTRWITAELYGVSHTDLSTYAAVAVVMTVVTLLACAIPTRRALQVDPLTALRGD